MGDGSCLAAVRTELEGIKTTFPKKKKTSVIKLLAKFEGDSMLINCSVMTMDLNAESADLYSDLLSKVVEDHDVGIHVEEVVTVWWVFLHGPLLRFWTLIGENVITVFGLIIHTVKPCHL